MKKALIVVDVQNDFCEGGNLAVNGGNSIVPIINDLMPNYDLVVATIDAHPSNHKSFASNNEGANIGDMRELGGQAQFMWPNHCVDGTYGQELHPELNQSLINKSFRKGQNPEIDSYSGFFDNDKRSSTGLGEWLKSQGIDEVHVVGLALDYCVKATAIDAFGFGFKTTVINRATRAVNIKADDGLIAIRHMERLGIKIDNRTGLNMLEAKEKSNQ